MTSWEWVEENPVMTEKQFARFCLYQQMNAEDAADFRAECQAYRIAGGYYSAKIIGAAGF